MKESLVMALDLARKRREVQKIHDSLLKEACHHFEVWSYDMELLESTIKERTDEVRQCIEDIDRDRKRYREIIERVAAINVADLCPEELQKKSAGACRLLDMAKEISALESQLPQKVEKLTFLL